MQGLRFHENECVHFLWNAAPALPMLRISPLRGSNRSRERGTKQTSFVILASLRETLISNT
jgi:hypothetical protein